MIFVIGHDGSFVFGSVTSAMERSAAAILAFRSSQIKRELDIPTATFSMASNSAMVASLDKASAVNGSCPLDSKSSIAL